MGLIAKRKKKRGKETEREVRYRYKIFRPKTPFQNFTASAIEVTVKPVWFGLTTRELLFPAPVRCGDRSERCWCSRHASMVVVKKSRARES
jgi:hypothetical protein